MFRKKINLVSVSAELTPFAKSGGLADVAGTLPKALKKQGLNVWAVTPYYTQIIDQQTNSLKKITELEIRTDEQASRATIWQGWLDQGLPVFFIENDKFFGRKTSLYGSTHENQRFYFFNLTCLRLLEELKIEPDIIQCHDWHTGLIPYLLKNKFKHKSVFKKTASVFTIHNLAFQFGKNWWEVPAEKRDTGRHVLPKFNSPEIEYINFAKRAILNADVINTVSEQYAEEILTKKYGEELQRILTNRQDRLFGIVNGIDYFEYNPKTDPGLCKNYDSNSLELKLQNKLNFQKEHGLAQTEAAPLISLTSRLSEQKGFDIIMEIIDQLMRLNIQLVLLGEGEKKYENFFHKLEKRNPKKVFAQTYFEPQKETQILAAADMLLLPSRFEPCGIGQLKSLRYGCVPIVHNVGGLAETISHYNPQTGGGNGFVFRHFASSSLLVAIASALQEYKHKDSWRKLVTNGMNESFSWEIPAQKYIQLFKRALKLKQTKSNH